MGSEDGLRREVLAASLLGEVGLVTEWHSLICDHAAQTLIE